MNTQQQRRAEIITRLIAGKLTGGEAAQLLGVSARQLRRVRQRFIDDGVSTIVHGNTRRAPHNRSDTGAVERLRTLCGAGGKYHDFNVSHLCDMLARDEGIKVTRPTLARLLVLHGIRTATLGVRRAKRQRRERRAHEGALLQIDRLAARLVRGARAALHLARLHRRRDR